MFALAIIIAALAGVALAVLRDRLTPEQPHPDLGRIQWPVPVDPTITIERRSS